MMWTARNVVGNVVANVRHVRHVAAMALLAGAKALDSDCVRFSVISDLATELTKSKTLVYEGEEGRIETALVERRPELN